MSFSSLKRMHDKMNFDGGFKIEKVTILKEKNFLIKLMKL